MEITEKKEYPFEFSIIMPVYNVELFIREAVDSVVAQDFGLDKVQLILVDDGSTDGSGAICDAYAERYPGNVFAVHKKNGGLSSARNEGLKYASGRYINFTDSDDKLSANCLSEVKAFFDKNAGKTDVTAVPIFFFDGGQGEHGLNYKFDAGSRVIDLSRNYNMIQIAVNSAFFAAEAVKGLWFDTRMTIAEDGDFICRVLLEKMTLGVVNTPIYWYRKRTTGQASLIQGVKSNRSWYLNTPEYFYRGIIEYAEGKCGYVPRFVQFAVCHDMKWRLLMEDVPREVLTEEEFAAYKEKIFSVLRYIDDEVILNQRTIYSDRKLYLLGKKYGRAPYLIKHPGDAIVSYSPSAYLSLAYRQCKLELLTRQNNGYLLEGDILAFPFLSDIDVYAEINGEKRLCEKVPQKKPERALGEDVLYHVCFRVFIPCDQETTRVKILYTTEGTEIYCRNIAMGHLFPITQQHNNSYCYENGKVIYFGNGTLCIRDCGRMGRLKREWAFCKELWRSNRRGERKAVVARTVAHIAGLFKRKPIWLISDRMNKADDNGEAFFRYMRAEHRKEISCFYTVLKSSADYDRMKKDGHIVATHSFRHKILFLMSDCNISSQADAQTRTPFLGYDFPYRDIQRKIKQVFLQHGIIQNSLADWLNRYNKDFSGFVTSAYPEYKSIVDGDYRYTDKEVWLTGMPRYDRLYHDEKKIITVMPTWRQYLLTGMNSETGVRNALSGFCDSEYYRFFNALLNDERLLAAAERCGYHLCFMPHPNIQPSASLFTHHANVTFFPAEKSYRDIYAASNLVVTDYSSAAFDFAYLRKPIVYCQFDHAQFFSGSHVTKPGYFDYERDGFGEVEYDLAGTVDRIIEYMENGCALKDKYRERIDSFFAFNDTDNCRRVYEKILELDNRKG